MMRTGALIASCWVTRTASMSAVVGILLCTAGVSCVPCITYLQSRAPTSALSTVVRPRFGMESVSMHATRHCTGAAPEAAASAAKQAPAAVTSLHHLNDVHVAMLMAGCADGTVRVWRNHTFCGQQRLSTAFQAVPVTGGAVLGGPVARAVFAHSERWGSLLAAGGTAPLHVHMWSLLHEQCIQQFELGEAGGAACVSHLAASQRDGHLVAATTDGRVHLLDPRVGGGAVASLQPHSGALVGLALEPGAQPHVLVTGSAVEGTLKLSDVRMTGQLPEAHTPSGQGTAHMGVCKTFNTELRGRLTAMAAHSSAPLIAAGSSHQMVKLWNARGEEQGLPIRIHTHLLAARPGPLSHLAFHPHRLQLAVATDDPFVTLFELHHPRLEHVGSASVAAHSSATLHAMAGGA